MKLGREKWLDGYDNTAVCATAVQFMAVFVIIALLSPELDILYFGTVLSLLEWIGVDGGISSYFS